MTAYDLAEPTCNQQLTEQKIKQLAAKESEIGTQTSDRSETKIQFCLLK